MCRDAPRSSARGKRGGANGSVGRASLAPYLRHITIARRPDPPLPAAKGKMKILSLSLALACLALAACSADKSSGPSRADVLFVGCGIDEDCPAGGRCVVMETRSTGVSQQGICSFDCKTDDDCAVSDATSLGNIGREYFEGSCATVGGAATCLPACGVANSRYLTCREDVPQLCSEADGTHCQDCGCPTGQVCEKGVGCFAPRAVGERCANDEDCSSANCSKTAKVCRVKLFEPCTTENCDRCMKRPGGEPYCTRGCSGVKDCDGRKCAHPADQPSYPDICWPPCEKGFPSCDGTCFEDEGQEGRASEFGYVIRRSCWCPTSCTQLMSK